MFLKTILQFVFIYLSLIIGIPGTDKFNTIKNKIILFAGVFLYQLIVNSIYKNNSKCKQSIKDILVDSIFSSFIAIIGYSFYIDLLLLNDTRDILLKYIKNKQMAALIISSMITISIFITKFLQKLLKDENCEKYYYKY